jgi:hypothetical protein
MGYYDDDNSNIIQRPMIFMQTKRGGGGGTGDVTQSDLTDAISDHNFAPSSHSDIRQEISNEIAGVREEMESEIKRAIENPMNLRIATWNTGNIVGSSEQTPNVQLPLASVPNRAYLTVDMLKATLNIQTKGTTGNLQGTHTIEPWTVNSYTPATGMVTISTN